MSHTKPTKCRYCPATENLFRGACPTCIDARRKNWKLAMKSFQKADSETVARNTQVINSFRPPEHAVCEAGKVLGLTQ